jgi:thimet oligopeptidase
VNKNLLVGLLVVAGLVGGVFVLRGQKVSLGIKRDKTGYLRVETIEDVYGAVPLTADEIKARYDHVIKQVTEEVAAITALTPEQQTKEAVIYALDKAMGYLGYLAASLETIYLISPEKEVRQVGAQYYQETLKKSTELFEGNKKLYKVLKQYAKEKAASQNLAPEEQYFLTELLEELELEGLDLSDTELEKVLKVKKLISEIGTKFETNISTDNRTLEVAKDELKGVPEDFIGSLSKTEDGKFILKADYPTNSTIMRECAVGQTRKKFKKMMGKRGYPKNVAVLHELIKLRKELATLLGFESYAQFDLKRSMLGSDTAVWKLQKDLLPKAVAKSKKEFERFSQDLPEGVELSSNGKFYGWDSGYTVNYFKKKYYDIDETKLAEYFPMEQTIQGLFEIYQKFFGLKFEKIENSIAWHPEVRLLQVSRSDGQLLGYVFLDMFPRDNKFSHAAHSGVLSARHTGNETIAPGVSVLICNFTPARGDKPSLLKYSEVNTFFHEFGHALHSLMGTTNLITQAGTSVKRDFVEMPSQMLENWMEDKQILLDLGKHYKTGQKLPEELVDKKLELLKLGTGMHESSQIGAGMLSFDLFDKEDKKDLDAVQKKYHGMTDQFTEYDSDNKHYAAFGHLVGYGPKYYGYLWARILGADVFESVQKEGILNRTAGKRYSDAILLPGGSKDPAQLVRDYLGREPNQEAFLKKSGFQE